ncbi:hypothetical protein DL98DRAFT_512952 [Cadophora sp. DSE1049]|nr:hypothetical protein DL98DRAFT_512952 [Cadophora sp. DSE1049]
MLFGPGDRNLFVHNPEEKFVLLARFVSIEIGFEMLHFQGYKCLWDILGASTKLKKLTLRNGQEIGGAFFCETEGRLYYAGQSFDRLNDVRKPLEYLNSVLDKKVQKTLNFPGMRLCPPTGMFGNEIRLPREGSALPHIAKSLHAVFRGELWVNGNMWMKDGEEMDGLEGLIEQVKAESKELKRKQLEVMAAWEEEEEKRLRSSVPPIPGGVSGKRIVFGMPSYTA